MFMSQFDSRFPLRHQQKDMRLAIGMADEVEQPLHVTASANEVTAVGHMLSAKVVVVILFSNMYYVLIGQWCPSYLPNEREHS